MRISSLILNMSFNDSTWLWEHTDMKESGLYTMGVSLGQMKTLRINI